MDKCNNRSGTEEGIISKLKNGLEKYPEWISGGHKYGNHKRKGKRQSHVIWKSNICVIRFLEERRMGKQQCLYK